jgi:hypothetical protein
MAVDAILVYGTRLYDSPDGTTWTEYPDLRELESPGSPDAPDVDVTPLADTTDYRQFRIGLAVAGEFTVRQYFKKDRMSRVITAYRVQKQFRVTYPDHATPASASRVICTGYIKRFKPPPAPNGDEPAVIEFTVKITGGITYTEAS